VWKWTKDGSKQVGERRGQKRKETKERKKEIYIMRRRRDEDVSLEGKWCAGGEVMTRPRGRRSQNRKLQQE
jgi:hypothetical protein